MRADVCACVCVCVCVRARAEVPLARGLLAHALEVALVERDGQGNHRHQLQQRFRVQTAGF